MCRRYASWLRIRLTDTLPDQGYFAKYLIFADRILGEQMPRDRLTDLSRNGDRARTGDVD
jgi:hypothetical protein